MQLVELRVYFSECLDLIHVPASHIVRAEMHLGHCDLRELLVRQAGIKINGLVAVDLLNNLYAVDCSALLVGDASASWPSTMKNL